VIKVSVLYPKQEGSHFDMDYYCATHMPMAQRLLAPAIKGIAVEQGICGNTPDSPPTYAAMGIYSSNHSTHFLGCSCLMQPPWSMTFQNTPTCSPRFRSAKWRF